MIHFVSLLILAFAVSLDSFGVGLTYGLRKITIPLRSIIIIACCSAVMILLATGVAQGILLFLSPRVAEIFGGLILIALGAWALYHITRSEGKHRAAPPESSFQTHSRSREKHTREKHTREKQTLENKTGGASGKHVWTLELKKLGIVIQILRTPVVADMDRSGIISGTEAFVLGLALSLDAFGAGMGAALMGYSPWLTAVLIGTMSSVFVYLGIKFGDFFADARWISQVSYLPGIILITFGLLRMF